MQTHLLLLNLPLPYPFPPPIKPLHFKFPPPQLQFPSHSHSPKHALTHTYKRPNLTIPSSLPALHSLTSFLHPSTSLILRGWSLSALSVLSLSKLIPLTSRLSTSSPSPTTTLSSLPKDAAIVAALFSVRLVANYLQQAFLWEAAFSTACEVRCFVFKKVLERDLGFWEGDGAVLSGDVAHRISAEGSDVADTVFALLNTVVPCTLQLSAMVAQMLAISPILTLVSALVIPCVALAITLLGARLQKISRKAHLSIAALSAYLNEVLPSTLFVKASNMEWSESVRFKMLAYDDLSRQLDKKKMKALVPQVVQAVYFGALFVISAVFMVLSKGSFDRCSFIAFVTSLVFLVEPIQDVGKAYNEVKQGEPAIDRLFDLTRFKPSVTEPPDAIDIEFVRGEVDFQNISFQYRDNSPSVLNGVDLHIKAGETVALVGPSGGGKTTLVKLLMRLYDPLCGSILIDGHDIQSVKLESLRRHVGLVSQDIMLFSGTVVENIGYRDLMKGIDLERVKHASKIANADEFIESLPKGFETNIGPRGSILSGGQRQRLAIARALYQNPSVLILDEATSALDTRSEMLVRQAMERLMKNHTVLVIAHRLETVLMAERVILLENGRLQEVNRSALVEGNHGLQSAGLVI